MWEWLKWEFGKESSCCEVSDLANSELRVERAQLTTELRQAKNELKRIKRSIKQRSRRSTFVIDFEGMNVVSFERFVDENNVSYSVIGYMNRGTGEPSGWLFYCSLTTHEMLAAQFKQYLKEKADEQIKAY